MSNFLLQQRDHHDSLREDVKRLMVTPDDDLTVTCLLGHLKSNEEAAAEFAGRVRGLLNRLTQNIPAAAQWFEFQAVREAL